MRSRGEGLEDAGAIAARDGRCLAHASVMVVVLDFTLAGER